MGACPSLMFVELCESGIGIRNRTLSNAHAIQACIATGPVSFRGIIKKSCELGFEMSLRKLLQNHTRRFPTY